jgi:hypothetical protein
MLLKLAQIGFIFEFENKYYGALHLMYFFPMSFYKYFAALLLYLSPDISKHSVYLSVNEYDGNRKVQSTIIFVE